MRIRTVVNVGVSIFRNLYLKMIYRSRFMYKGLYSCPISTHIEIGKGAMLNVGRRMSARRNLTINVRDNAKVVIGDRVIFNDNCTITSRQCISIGDDVIFGPGCYVFDHDHDYAYIGMERKNIFLSDQIKIGDGVWFGANCIILKGTSIGDNCVFSAGSVIKGNYDSNQLVIQKREENKKDINFKYDNLCKKNLSD